MCVIARFGSGATSRDTPKSPSLTTPEDVMNMFCSLRSRWIAVGALLCGTDKRKPLGGNSAEIVTSSFQYD